MYNISFSNNFKEVENTYKEFYANIESNMKAEEIEVAEAIRKEAISNAPYGATGEIGAGIKRVGNVVKLTSPHSIYPECGTGIYPDDPNYSGMFTFPKPLKPIQSKGSYPLRWVSNWKYARKYGKEGVLGGVYKGQWGYRKWSVLGQRAQAYFRKAIKHVVEVLSPQMKIEAIRKSYPSSWKQ